MIGFAFVGSCVSKSVVCVIFIMLVNIWLINLYENISVRKLVVSYYSSCVKLSGKG